MRRGLSVAIRRGMIQEYAKPTLICPGCGKSMRFARSLPGIGALPELLTFDCEACAVSLTKEKATLVVPAGC